MTLNRVVITGTGTVTPIGNTVDAMMQSLDEGVSAVRVMQPWNRFGPLRCQLGAPVSGCDGSSIPRKFRRTMSRMSIYAVLAARQAVQQAGLTDEQLSHDPSIGCVLGSTTGSPDAITASYEILLGQGSYLEMGGPEFFRCVSHTLTLNLAQCLGIRGMALATSAACASGLQAVGSAFDAIRLGRQQVMLCGGAEELHETTVGSFDILYAASAGFNDRPTATPRPFDNLRDGLVCGEGAGIVVLEAYEHARARGATILGEVLGYSSCGNGTHVTLSDAAAMSRCMRGALADAGCSASDMAYISAHATGTRQGDEAEAKAIADVFGDAIPCSSLKGHMGHTLGASGAIELIASLRMLKAGRLLPTLNLQEIDPACRGPKLIQVPTPSSGDLFVKNSFAFGGINVAMVCRAAV